MPITSGIHHVAYRCKDAKQTVEFYRDVLDMDYTTAFAEDQLDVSSRWTLIAGLQWTDSNRRYEDHFLSNGDQSLDASYSRVSRWR